MGESFYGRRGSSRLQREDDSRYYMRQGMARVALEMRAGVKRADVYGRDLPYAKRMADGASASTLEKWRKGSRVSYSIGGDADIVRIPRAGRKIYVYSKQKKGLVRVA